MTKRPSDEALREDMNKYARALLKSSYGALLIPDQKSSVEGDETPNTDNDRPAPKPDVFNAVVNWIRTDAGMEPIDTRKSGLDSLTEEMKRGRKR